MSYHKVMGRGSSSTATLASASTRQDSFITVEEAISYLAETHGYSDSERCAFITEQAGKLDWGAFNKLVKRLQQQPVSKKTVLKVISDAVGMNSHELDPKNAFFDTKQHLGYLADWEELDRNRNAREQLLSDLLWDRYERQSWVALCDLIDKNGSVLKEANQKYPAFQLAAAGEARRFAGAKASEALDLPIPQCEIEFTTDERGFRQSIGQYYYDNGAEQRFSLLREGLQRGDRIIAFWGASGAGKSKSVEQLAAIANQPYLQTKVGHGDRLVVVQDDNGNRAELLMEADDAELLPKALSNGVVVEFAEGAAASPEQTAMAQQIVADAATNNKPFDYTVYDAGSMGIIHTDPALVIHAQAIVAFTFCPLAEYDPRLTTQVQENVLGLRVYAPNKTAAKN